MAAGDGHLRASDAERERVIEGLRRHTAEGRLTLEEFEQRVAEAYAATTRDDLRPVLRDLPPPQPAPPPAAGPPRPALRRLAGLDTGAALRTVAIVVAATVIIASGWQLWWIVFPLMGLLGGCGKGARSCATGRSRHSVHHHGRDRVPEADHEVIRV